MPCGAVDDAISITGHRVYSSVNSVNKDDEQMFVSGLLFHDEDKLKIDQDNNDYISTML